MKQLAKLNLSKDYQFVNLAEKKQQELVENNEIVKVQTPVKLVHFYMEVKIGEKLDILFSFIKSHTKSKGIVFFSSCKQVRFAYETFKKLKVGASILELHGRQK